MASQELHRAQLSILRTLRHAPAARYSELLRPTGLESDAFKFHLRKLVRQNYVYKSESGAYELTPSGKEFANNLSKTDRAVQKQPKLSVVIVAMRETDGTTEYLFQQRLRNPFYDFWGCLSGPVQWGESFELAARREFEKQTGLTAQYTVRSFYRETDRALETDVLLEDKLYVIVIATDVQGEIANTWQKGFNTWMTLAELQGKAKYFASTSEFIQMLTPGTHHRAREAHYADAEY